MEEQEELNEIPRNKINYCSLLSDHHKQQAKVEVEVELEVKTTKHLIR